MLILASRAHILSPFLFRDAGGAEGVRYTYAGRSVRVRTSAIAALKVRCCCAREKVYIYVCVCIIYVCI